uniref:Transposase n=1 Tax=Rhodococcus sp. NS1 TaxID=402236 RepID=A0A097SQM3_9NOCA|nr:hypothetical protein LRS1606.404 [Rhodococcus sp. NS1]
MSLMAMKAYSAEFKADAVALYLSDPNHTYEGIGKDLGISRETLRNWVRAERKRTGTSETPRPPRTLSSGREVSVADTSEGWHESGSTDLVAESP